MNLVEKIEKAIQEVINGYKSEYFNCKNEAGEDIKIRVSHHSANPIRMESNDISLVVIRKEDLTDKNDDDDEYVSSIKRSNKSFAQIANQYYLDEFGAFTEQFKDVAELLAWHEIIN